MKKLTIPFLIILLLGSCNPAKLTFFYIYNDEGPNKQIAEKMKILLESKYNVEIMLIEGVGTNENLDSLIANKVDIALVENYVEYREGVSSAFSVYSEVLHIFYKEGVDANSFLSLMQENPIYLGKEGSPTYNLVMDLCDFYGVDPSKVEVTQEMNNASVVVELTNLFTKKEIQSYEGYHLFSFDRGNNMGGASVIEGISLKFPRLSPFLIPQRTYWDFTEEAVVTLSVDLVMMVRSSMLESSVNDFTKTMLRNRQIFTSIDPLLFHGLREDFNQAKLNIPLHEGARVFFDRDEPNFVERYAELGGVAFSIILALWSGAISFTKWKAQKKKDKIDEFYENLINIKNEIPSLNTVRNGVSKIKQVQEAQKKAFKMLMEEKLVANESFRIYMELSKETITEIRGKMRTIKMKQKG